MKSGTGSVPSQLLHPRIFRLASKPLVERPAIKPSGCAKTGGRASRRWCYSGSKSELSRPFFRRLIIAKSGPIALAWDRSLTFSPRACLPASFDASQPASPPSAAPAGPLSKRESHPDDFRERTDGRSEEPTKQETARSAYPLGTWSCAA